MPSGYGCVYWTWGWRSARLALLVGQSDHRVRTAGRPGWRPQAVPARGRGLRRRCALSVCWPRAPDGTERGRRTGVTRARAVIEASPCQPRRPLRTRENAKGAVLIRPVVLRTGARGSADVAGPTGQGDEA